MKNGVPGKSQTFWGKEEQRNERAFAASGETNDMEFVTTRRQGGTMPIFLQQGSSRSPPLHTSPPLNLLYQPKKRDRCCGTCRTGEV